MEVQELLRALIEEYLTKENLSETLKIFQEETSSKNESLLRWEEVGSKLQLPLDEKPIDTSILSHLVENYLRERALRMRMPAERCFEKLLTTPKPSRPLNTIASAPVLSTLPSPTRTSPKELYIPDPTSKGKSAKTKKSQTVQRLQDKKSLPRAGSAGLAVSTENWLPFNMRMNSIGRGVMVAHANIKTVSVQRASDGKYQRSDPLSEYHAFKLAEEELHIRRRAACACCEVMFPRINLVMQVSYKAVIDRRKKWDPDMFVVVEDETELEESRGSTAREKAWDRLLRPAVGKGHAQTGSRLITPKFYDEVSICGFCAQFFMDQDEYRPSRKDVERALRREQLQLRREAKDKLDPLWLCEEDRRLEEEQEKLLAASGGTGLM